MLCKNLHGILHVHLPVGLIIGRQYEILVGFKNELSGPVNVTKITASLSLPIDSKQLTQKVQLGPLSVRVPQSHLYASLLRNP